MEFQQTCLNPTPLGMEIMYVGNYKNWFALDLKSKLVIVFLLPANCEKKGKNTRYFSRCVGEIYYQIWQHFGNFTHT